MHSAHLRDHSTVSAADKDRPIASVEIESSTALCFSRMTLVFAESIAIVERKL
jgi:hypothetical protein